MITDQGCKSFIRRIDHEVKYIVTVIIIPFKNKKTGISLIFLE